MPAFQRKQRVLGRKQLQGALPAAFLVLAAQPMEFLPGARLDHSHRDFAAGDDCLERADGPAVFEAAAGALAGMRQIFRITEPATPIPVTGWTPFLGHGFLGPFDSGPSKAFRMASM